MTADTALIKRALEQAKEQFEWLSEQGEREVMPATQQLLRQAIKEAEKLQ